jgi:cell wall-associated NlpC family hydrolase
MRLILAIVALALLSGCAAIRVGDPAAVRAPTVRGAHDPALAQDVASHALRFLGVPYRYGGDTPDTGFDCSGLVWRVYHQVAGISLPRQTRAMSEVGGAVPREALQPGDLVFFNTLRRPYSHVGIYLGGQRFIHAPAQGGVVETVGMRERYWRERFDGARRVIF